MFGQRVVGFEADSSGSVSLAFFDFDQRRVSAQARPDAESSGEVCTPGSQYPISVGKSVFCAGETRASRKYIKTSIPYGDHMDILTRIVGFDDEHCKYMRALVAFRPLTKRHICSDYTTGRFNLQFL